VAEIDTDQASVTVQTVLADGHLESILVGRAVSPPACGVR